MLTIFNRRTEGFGKILGYQQSKIGIIGLHIPRLVGMSIDYRQPVIVILCRHLSGRIGAEHPDLVVESRCVIHQLCFIQLFVQLLHDLIPDLYTDAYIHGAVSGLDAVFLADVGKPAGSFPAYAHHDLRSVKAFTVFCHHAFCSSILYDQILNHRHKADLYALLQQMLLETGINLIALFRSQMADGTFDQF